MTQLEIQCIIPIRKIDFVDRLVTHEMQTSSRRTSLRTVMRDIKRGIFILRDTYVAPIQIRGKLCTTRVGSACYPRASHVVIYRCVVSLMAAVLEKIIESCTVTL